MGAYFVLICIMALWLSVRTSMYRVLEAWIIAVVMVSDSSGVGSRTSSHVSVVELP